MPTDSQISVSNAKYYVDNVYPVLNGDLADPFFFQDQRVAYGARFSQYFPYQLVILNLSADQDRNATYTETGWVFTLPIPPQELQINMPIATSLQVTLGGISEQHGGVPLRDIILSGTTGVTPVKNQANPQDSDFFNALQSTTIGTIFAGTITNVNKVVTGAKNLFNPNGVNNVSNINQPITDNDGADGNDPNRIPAKSTGYYQFKVLERFIESYELLKKTNKSIVTPKGFQVSTRDLRLALYIWKDESRYLCAGVNFAMNRSAARPLEYMYTLHLRAWKRIKIESASTINNPYSPVGRRPEVLNQLLNRLKIANDILLATNQIFRSVVQDPTGIVIEIGRETSLFLKSVTNLPHVIADIPNSIVKEMLPILSKNWNNVSTNYPTLGNSPPSILTTGPNKLLNLSSNPINQQTRPSIVDPNFSPTTVNITSNATLQRVFNTVKANDLPLSPIILKRIRDEMNRVKGFKRIDFENKRTTIRQFSNNFADAVGAGGSTYNRVYNRGGIPSTRTTLDDEWNILFALNEVCVILDHLAASNTVDPVTPTSLEYVAGLAQRSGIVFKVPQSKIAIPFPYGFTLERLAQLYLGNADRWHEIAILNGLKEPFVDEAGFTLPFLTDGNGNTLYVSDNTNLYVNQTVWIGSNAITANKRHITGIKQIYTNFFSVTVDGNNDLVNYTTLANALLTAYLPGTVNSQQVIYLPSDKSTIPDNRTKSIPGINVFDPLLNVSGIDLLLNQNNDLVIGPDGDCRFAVGLQNLIQTVKIALSTPRGTLMHHPGFGLIVPVGTSTADVNAADLLKSVQQMFEGDPAFTGVSSATIQKNGPILTITLTIGIVGISYNVPITLQVLH